MQVSRGTWLRLAAQLSAALLSIVRGERGAHCTFSTSKNRGSRGRPCATPIFERSLFFSFPEEPREIFN